MFYAFLGGLILVTILFCITRSVKIAKAFTRTVREEMEREASSDDQLERASEDSYISKAKDEGKSASQHTKLESDPPDSPGPPSSLLGSSALMTALRVAAEISRGQR